MAKTKLQKHLNYLFLNTTPSVTAETWKRVGKSTEWTDTMNVKTTTYEYIEDSGPTDVIENYQPSTNMPLTAFIGDPVYEYVFELYRTQDVGKDTYTKAMRVFQNKKGAANLAQMSDVTITIENYNYATGVITFTMKQGGTPVHGTATLAESTDADGSKVYTPTFTPDA